MLASIPDVLRLLTLPAFAWIAWRDVRTRRVPNRTWLPLAALAVALLAWELFTVFTGDVSDLERQRFLLRVGISVGFVVPLAYGFWLIGGFGGADAKAFMVIAILFPTYPVIDLAALGLEGQLATLPVVEITIGVFSLTILSNTVVAGIAYPVVLAGRNALRGYVSPGMFVAKPIDPAATVEEYGSLLHFADRSLTDDLSLSGLRDYFTWRGLDLDALRMYLAWRGAALADLRADPEHYRDPESLPAEPNPPGDGAIPTDGGRPADDEAASDDGRQAEDDESATDAPAHDDPWGAEAFLADIEHSAYGTEPEDLREGLDSLVQDDVVWISPGIPFLVPLFAGLVLAVTAGDVLFAAFQAVGIA